MPIGRRPGPFRPTSTRMKAVRGVESLPLPGQTLLHRALARQLGSDSAAKLFLDEVMAGLNTGEIGSLIVSSDRNLGRLFVARSR